MLDVREALESVLSFRLHSYSVTAPLGESLSRVLAEDIFADRDQPPFDRVMMDGIAINKELLGSTKIFKILGTISAGSEQMELPLGEVCFEIMTGAVLPKNSDMVIRYEDLKIENGLAKVVVDKNQLSPNFHQQGSDYRKGDQVLFKNTKIKSTTTALLASVGRSQVQVYNIPQIAILSTGDELVEIEDMPGPHQIRWSNGISLKQELRSYGLSDVVVYKIKDDEFEMKNVMADLINTKDVLLMTGGVSAGKYDFVPKLLKECKVHEIFHKVAQRPGKPLWFGKTDRDVFVFGLPGNPVSCLVSLRKFVIPFLCQSVPGQVNKTPKAFLGADVKCSTSLTYYCPVKIENEAGRLIAWPLPGNGSGDFFQLRDSDGFIELNPEDAPFTAGSMGNIFLWGLS